MQIRPIRFKISPETFNRLMNAAQYIADVAASAENAGFEQAAIGCISEVMNNSAIMEQYIDRETGTVEWVNFACSEVTLRNMLSIAEAAADAAKSGYSRDYVAALIVQTRERRRMRIDKSIADSRAMASEWKEFRDKPEHDGLDADVLKDVFCKDHGISRVRLDAALKFDQKDGAVNRGEKVTIEVPDYLKGTAAADAPTPALATADGPRESVAE